MELVSIPSPSGNELDVGHYIKERLAAEGIDAHFDDSGKNNDSNSGNLIATIDGSGHTLLFLAHMDTVEQGKTTPIIEGDTIKTDGNSILGADNKASVAPLMHAIISAKKKGGNPKIIAAFTTREENGSMGAGFLDLKEHVDFVFVVDGSNKTGTFINKALGQMPFYVEITGKEVHAAKDPEKGANAIKAAGIMLTALDIGKKQDGSTLNIGTISGGTFVNVVPGKVVMKGEARAYEQNRINERLVEIENAASSACEKTGCTYSIRKIEEEGAPAFSIEPSNKIVELAKKASAATGVEFNLDSLNGTCEANVISGKFDNIICMSRGGNMPHSKNESITKQELKAAETLIENLIFGARDFA